MARPPSPRQPLLLPPQGRIVPPYAIQVCEERRHVKVEEASGYIIGLDIQYCSPVTGETRWVPDYPPARFESRQTLTYLGFSNPITGNLWLDYQEALQHRRPDTAYNLWIFLDKWIEGEMRAHGWQDIHYDHSQAPVLLNGLMLNGAFRDWLHQRHLGSQLGREPRRTIEQHILRYMRRKVEMLRQMDELVTGRTVMVADVTYYIERLDGEGMWSSARTQSRT